MKKKLLLQDFSEHLVRSEGVSKKDAETFVRAFFEVIEQGLLEDKFVKIKGFGTFKLVAVSERESVNINTGERFQISGHTKVTFTPDNGIKELINRPFAHFETVDLSDETETNEFDAIDEAYHVAQSEEEEQQQALFDENTDDDNADFDDEGAESIEKPQESIAAAEINSNVTANEMPTAVTDTTAEASAATDAENTEKPTDALIKEDEAPNAVNHAEEEVKEITTGAVQPINSEELNETEVVTANAVNTTQEVQQVQKVTVEEEAENTPASDELPHTAQTETTPQHAENAEEDIVVTQPQTITPYSEFGNIQVDYTYNDQPPKRKLNKWKTAFIVLSVLVLMALSYFAGYYRVLCPCSYPVFDQFFEPTPTATARTNKATPATNRSTANPQPTQVATKSAPAAATTPAMTTKAPANTQPSTSQPTKPATPAPAKPTTASQPAASQPAATATTTPEAPKKPQYHTVKDGDNLYKISRRYYGSDKYVQSIIKQNHLKNADNLISGTRLVLP